MEPLNIECDLQSLRRLYSLLLIQSNANKEYVPQAFLLDENSQFLLKRLLDSATKELLSRQHKVLAQAQLGLQESVSTPSKGIVKLPSSKVGITKQVVDSIERIETQLSAFQFCSTRGDTTRSSCKSPSEAEEEEEEEEDYSSSVMRIQRLNEKALMEPRQSYLMSQTRRASKKIAPSLRSRYDPTLVLHSRGSSSHDDQIVLATSRPPRPPLRSVGFEKPRQSNRTSQSMKPTLLLDQGTSEELVSSSTEQESEEASRETVSTSGSSWETHSDSVAESDSSYPPESDADDDDENSQASDSPPRRSRDDTGKQRKKKTLGRLKRFKEKLGKVFHHHHYHHHEHHNKEEEEHQGRKPTPWKHLVKKHLQKDKEKLVEEKRMKTDSKGLLTTHNNNKGGQFHALVKGFMKNHKRHSKNNKKQKTQTLKRQGGVKFPKRGSVKLEKNKLFVSQG